MYYFLSMQKAFQKVCCLRWAKECLHYRTTRHTLGTDVALTIMMTPEERRIFWRADLSSENNSV